MSHEHNSLPPGSRVHTGAGDVWRESARQPVSYSSRRPRLRRSTGRDCLSLVSLCLDVITAEKNERWLARLRFGATDGEWKMRKVTLI